MPSIETMTLDELEATMAALRARRKALKATRTQVDRKVAVLTRRKERVLAKVAALDEQILQLRGETRVPITPATPPARRRGRPPKVQPTS